RDRVRVHAAGPTGVRAAVVAACAPGAAARDTRRLNRPEHGASTRADGSRERARVTFPTCNEPAEWSRKDATEGSPAQDPAMDPVASSAQLGVGRHPRPEGATMTPVESLRTPAAVAEAERWTAHNYPPLPVVIAEASGAWVTDIDGRRYLDCL